MINEQMGQGSADWVAKVSRESKKGKKKEKKKREDTQLKTK